MSEKKSDVVKETPPPPAPDPLAGTAAFLWSFRLCIYGLLVAAFVYGGPIVRVGAAGAALFALTGDRAGALRQLVNLAGLPITLTIAANWGPALGDELLRHVSMAPPLARWLAGAGVVALGLLITSVLGRLVTRYTRERRYLYVLNRTGGALLGVTEGAMLAAALCWTSALFGPALSLYAQNLADKAPVLARIFAYLDDGGAWLRTDPTSTWLLDHNVLAEVPMLQTTAAVAEVTGDTATFWALVDSRAMKDLLAEPAVRRHLDAIRNDPALKAAVASRDVSAILRSPHFDAALADDELGRVVARHWPALQAQLSVAQVQKARQAAAALDSLNSARLERAYRRAQELGLDVPAP